MNLSGKAVRYWLNMLKIPVSNLLVVVDDIALPLGSLRMRARGSDAGHNGMRDIESTLGSNEYPRLRFGIGDNFYKGNQVEYVLSRFSEDEFKLLPAIIDRACDMILSFGTIGIDRTMNQYN
jgi:PTH1 family peptidyl-tRNA hydrolase